MKSQLLSIFAGTTDQDSATETNDARNGSTNPRLASYHNRYQEFLNQQTAPIQPRSFHNSSPVRFLQGMFSLAVFVAMFLAILTLVGFGLSSLGVIAQVSPSSVSASGKTAETMKAVPPAPVSPKRKSQRQ